MTLREIFSSIGGFFGNAWNRLLDLDILMTIGFFVMIIYPPFLIISLAKKQKPGPIILAVLISSLSSPGTKEGDFFYKKSVDYNKKSKSITVDDLF